MLLFSHVQISTPSKQTKNILNLCVENSHFIIFFFNPFYLLHKSLHTHTKSVLYQLILSYFLPLLIMVHALESLQIIVKTNQLSKLHGCKISLNDAKNKPEKKGSLCYIPKDKSNIKKSQITMHFLIASLVFSATMVHTMFHSPPCALAKHNVPFTIFNLQIT